MAGTWRDVRARANLDETNVAAHRDRMRSEIQAYRLREVRERMGLTQTQVASRMRVSQPRVSAIEGGLLADTGVSTLAKYIESLGGRLQIVAEFGDDRVALC